MCEIFRTLWNRINGLFVLTALALAGVVPAGEGAGTPTVTMGGASFARDGDNLTVTTTDHRTIIGWDHFGVPAASLIHFAQPGVNSAVLNRVTGSLPSRIDGTLTSNGAVYLANPHGVVVGSSGVVRTGGGFVGTTRGRSAR
jgi:filamentous hemagglutinin family protein